MRQTILILCVFLLAFSSLSSATEQGQVQKPEKGLDQEQHLDQKQHQDQDSEYPEIEVRALFPNAALLSIDGEELLLKAGQEDVEGIKLIRADTQEVELQFTNENRIFKLSKRVTTVFKPVDSAPSVSISLDGYGRYMTAGSINNKPLELMVDTGASTVALNSDTATELGIDFEKGIPIPITTASGAVRGFRINLDSVQVGEIRMANVEAIVIRGKYPEKALLGMSFLLNMEIKQTSNVLVLTSKQKLF